MNPERDYLSILANLTSFAPLDLDAQVFDAPRVGKLSDVANCAFSPSSALWDTPNDGPSHIGLRVKAPVKNPDFLAARLACIAIERQVLPVFLSHIGACGMQRFGFRVEQVSGLTERAQKQFELQLARFWRFALVIDASEIEHLG